MIRASRRARDYGRIVLSGSCWSSCCPVKPQCPIIGSQIVIAASSMVLNLSLKAWESVHKKKEEARKAPDILQPYLRSITTNPAYCNLYRKLTDSCSPESLAGRFSSKKGTLASLIFGVFLSLNFRHRYCIFFPTGIIKEKFPTSYTCS